MRKLQRDLLCSLYMRMPAVSVSLCHCHTGRPFTSLPADGLTPSRKGQQQQQQRRQTRGRQARWQEPHEQPHGDAVAAPSPSPSSPLVSRRDSASATRTDLPLDAYVSTLGKPLTPRRHHSRPGPTEGMTAPLAPAALDPTAAVEEWELAQLTAKDGYDPATVVRLDRRRGRLHLNPAQRALVWAGRRKEYQASLERIVTCLQSHRTPIEKCLTLLALHDDAIQRRLRLRVDTYEDIFHTFYAVAVQTHGASSHVDASAQASLTELAGQTDRAEAIHSNGSVPAELASPTAASRALLTPHMVDSLWQMYRYMVDSGTDPSARVVQYVIGVLEHAVAQATHGPGAAAGATTLLEAKAHSLLLDLDRFHLTPTEYTVNAYIGVCDGCGVLHLAVARVADLQSRHEQQPTAGTYARLLTGLVRHSLHKEAMSVVSTLQSVPMTAYLLNAVLQAARFSPDPASTFAFYRAAVRTQGSTALRPTQVTFSILLEVLLSELADGAEKGRRPAGTEARLDFLLREMRKHRVKGNGLFLNNLLRVLWQLGRHGEATALQRSMEAKGVRVFDELRAPLASTQN